MKLLMQNDGQVIAKSVLLERISEDTPDCTENSLKTHISHLRGKLRQASGLGLSIAKLLTERMGGSIMAWYQNGMLSVSVRFPASSI